MFELYWDTLCMYYAGTPCVKFIVLRNVCTLLGRPVKTEV